MAEAAKKTAAPKQAAKKEEAGVPDVDYLDTGARVGVKNKDGAVDVIQGNQTVFAETPDSEAYTPPKKKDS